MTGRMADGAGPRRSRDLVLVGAAIATGVAGGLTLIISQRHLGLDAFAPLAQLWTIWAVLAAGFTFSFQQWAAIHPVDRVGLLAPGRHLRVTAVLVVLATVLAVTSYVIRDTLFHADSIVWPGAAGLVLLGTAVNGIRRGQLARAGDRNGMAAVIAGENVIRLIVSVVLVVAGASVGWFALALLAGFLVIIGPVRGVAVAADAVGEQRGFGTLGASATAGFLAHAFMFGSPILLTIAGGSATEVSALFLVLTGVRVPFVVLQALVPQLAVALATHEELPVLASLIRRRIGAVAVAGGLVAATLGFTLGDLVIGTVFGIRGEIDASAYALLSAASTQAACALVATVVLVVEGATRRIFTAWGVAAMTGVVAVAGGLVAEIDGLAIWLLVAHATVVVLAVVPDLVAPEGAAMWRRAQGGAST